MFNPVKVLQKAFVKRLEKGYKSTFGGLKSNYCEIIAWAGNIAIEILANSNALYHNAEHTMFVTLVGQAILRGMHIKEGGVTCELWLNCVISLLFHDIGYVRGVCKDDDFEKRLFATGRKKNEVVELPEGATDISLTPYHVDRGKLFIEERFGGHAIINSAMVKQNIELTRFPIPKERDASSNFRYPELVRAADLIGQLGDQRYIQKCSALFYEFEEIGANKKFGYKSPEDLVHSYPKFFWNMVYKHIKPCIKYLKVTQEGKNYLNGLYANVFSVEHEKVLKDSSSEENKLVILKSGGEKKSIRVKTKKVIKKKMDNFFDDEKEEKEVEEKKDALEMEEVN